MWFILIFTRPFQHRMEEGGPGSGPFGVKRSLVPFLPVPVIEKKDECFYLNYDIPKALGRFRASMGTLALW